MEAGIIPVTNIRKGQFIWRPPKAREKHILRLKQRIERNYYASEKVVNEIIDKLAPSFENELEKFM